MDAIKLRSGGLKDAYLGAFGEAEHVDYAGHAGLGRLNRIHLIMKLRCRAGKVVNFITSTKRGKVTLCRRSSSCSFALIRFLFAETNFKDYPKLRTRAKRCDTDIFFLDQAGARSHSALQRTWGAKGETPVVQTMLNGLLDKRKVKGITRVTPTFVEDTVSPLPSASESEMNRNMDLYSGYFTDVRGRPIT